MESGGQYNWTDLEDEQYEYYDYHATHRDRKLQKRKYGMRVSGRSVRLLEELSYRPKDRPKRSKDGRRR